MEYNIFGVFCKLYSRTDVLCRTFYIEYVILISSKIYIKEIYRLMAFFEAYLKQYLEMLTLPEWATNLINAYVFAFVLSSVVLLFILAFWGYKLLKACLAIAGAATFGIIGNTFIAPLVVPHTENLVPAWINVGGIIGMVLAGIGALLMVKLYKLGIFAEGAALGYFLGSTATGIILTYAPNLAFLNTPIGNIVVSCVLALILGVLFALLFKHIFILVTSVGGLCAAGVLIGSCFVFELNPVILTVSAGVGVIVGICAMVYQYKNARD